MQFHDPAIMSLAPPPGLNLPVPPQQPRQQPRQQPQQTPQQHSPSPPREPEDETEPLGWTSGPLIVYSRERMLELRRYGHVSEEPSRGRREGEVVPKGMPRRGEGIGQWCIYDPRKPTEQRRPFTRYNSNQRIEDGDLPKKIETSPTNRYHGLPIELSNNRRAQPSDAAGAGNTAGAQGERGWTGRRGRDAQEEPVEPRVGVGAGLMGRFQLMRGTLVAGREAGRDAGREERRRQPAEPTGPVSPPPRTRDATSDWRRGARPTTNETRQTKSTGGAERRYREPAAGATSGGRFTGGGRYGEPEEERTPEWMTDDAFPPGPPPGLAVESKSPVGEEPSAGWTADGGRDEIAAYREAMRAKDRRMRGLPEEEVTLAEPVEEEGPVSFLLPARRQVDVVVQEEVKVVPAAAVSRASRFMKSQEAQKPSPAETQPDRTADKTALLAGILNGMKPAGSPMSTPSQTHAAVGNSGQAQPLGMPMFFSAPPGIGSPGVAPAAESGKSNEHMNRLLGMLKGDGGPSPMASPVMAPPPMQAFAAESQDRAFASTQPERTFAGPPGINTASEINTAPPGINTAPGMNAGPPGSAATPSGRQSRFFKGHSTAPSAVQSPIESPVQAKHRLGDDKRGEPREEADRSPLHSLHASPQQPQQSREPRQGMESARSPVERLVPPPGFPPVGSPGVDMHNRPFSLGAPVPPPMDMMASPIRGQSNIDDASRQAMYRGPPQHQMGPPPFWQGPAPPGMLMGQGMMHPPQPGMSMPPPPGFMSPPHVYQQPPPGMMPPPFGAYASPGPAHGQPGMPFGMPPHVQPMPPFQQGYPGSGAGMPHQQPQSMTHDLMNLLGSMQNKN